MTQKFGQGFEGLEDRTLLAANVTATLLNGTLTIVGSTTVTADDIEVDGNGGLGNVRVTVNSATGLDVTNGFDGGSFGTFTGVTNIVINTGANDDIVNINDIAISGNLTANGGAGNNDQISLFSDDYGTFIGGNVVLNGGGGTSDDLSVSTESDYGLVIAGNLTMTTSGGNQEISTQGYGNVEILGNVVMNNISTVSSDSADSEIFTGSGFFGDGYGDIEIGGKLTMTGGAGNDFLSVATEGRFTTIDVNGLTTINGGAGNDDMWIEADSYGSNVETAAIVMNGGAGDNRFHVDTDARDSEVRTGSITMNGGANGDHMHVAGFGDNSDVTVTGSITMNGGAGIDYGIVDVTGSGTNLSVSGNVTINGGDGDDSLFMGVYGYASRIDVSGSVTMNGGNGNDFAGVQSYGSYSTISIANNLSLIGGAATETGADRLLISTENGNHDQEISIGQTVLMNGGGGNDSIESVNFNLGANNSITAKTVSLQGGDGDDFLGAYGNFVLGNVSLSGGNGNDVAYGSQNTVLGNFVFNGGNGNDSFYYGIGGNTVTGLIAFQSVETILP